MAWEENPRICLHMQLIAILSRIGVNIATSIEGLKEEKHELHLIPDTGVDNRGYATISPGTQRTVNLFLQQTSGYTHVYLYVVK